MNLGRVIFPAIRLEGIHPENVWPEIRDSIELGVGGFIVFGGAWGEVGELVRRANEHAGRRLLFASDLERGAGQQFAGATALPPPAALAALGREAVAEAACITTVEAAAAGIGWVFAPVADLDVEAENPIIGTRSFGSDPARVADLVRSWVESAQETGVHCCAKHFPGHGRTTVDSHARLPVVDEPRVVLEEDLRPFRAAIEAGVWSIMLAHASYPALDPSGRPASLSPAIIGYLRNELAFDGLVVTDAMIMDALADAGHPGSLAVVEAINAGCDVLLYPRSAAETHAALGEALTNGALDEARLANAIERVERATQAFHGSDEALTGKQLRQNSSNALALATRAVRVTGGSVAQLSTERCISLRIIDDDAIDAPESTADRRDVLARELRAAGFDVRPTDSDQGLDIIAVFCDVRAWKQRSGLGEVTRKALSSAMAASPSATLVVFAHPRLAAEIGVANQVLCAFSGDAIMQAAAAARLRDVR